MNPSDNRHWIVRAILIYPDGRTDGDQPGLDREEIFGSEADARSKGLELCFRTRSRYRQSDNHRYPYQDDRLGIFAVGFQYMTADEATTTFASNPA
jgi:hypothetical protein